MVHAIDGDINSDTLRHFHPIERHVLGQLTLDKGYRTMKSQCFFHTHRHVLELLKVLPAHVYELITE
jgi:hypothetical protein